VNPTPEKKPSPPKTVPAPLPITMTMNNEFIKKYADKLRSLWELGFTDVQRNLYLLISFNGDFDTVIEKLLEQ